MQAEKQNKSMSSQMGHIMYRPIAREIVVHIDYGTGFSINRCVTSEEFDYEFSDDSSRTNVEDCCFFLVSLTRK